MHPITKHMVMTAALCLAVGLLCTGCRIARKLSETCDGPQQEQPVRKTPALPEPTVERVDAALEPANLPVP